MTKINRLIMRGFKSFGQRTELIFGDKFNVVIGPNGSGKSNVMDSICFVLGKGSAKAMRAEKSANLIYNGGKEKEPAKEGEVSIFFDNKDKNFPLDVDEIKITRIIHHDGQSVYKINDQRRTRQEVHELITHGRIDPDGYNIILQGDIVRLVEMAPKERTLLIQEIAGIGVYEEKKEKALKELEKVDQKLSEAEIILSERRTSLRELKKERDQAEKYKDLSDKIKRNKATHLNMQIVRKTREKEEYEKKINELDEKIKQTLQHISSIRQEISERRAEIAKITKEIEEKGEKEQVNLMKDVEKLKIEVNSNKTRIESYENELVRLAARKQQLEESQEEIKKKIQELEKERIQHEKEKEQYDRDSDILEKKIIAFREKNKLDGAENIDKEIEEYDRKSEEKQREVQELREKQQNTLREKDKIDYQLLTIDEKVKKVETIAKENQEELEKLKHKKDEFKKATLELNQIISLDSNYAAQIGNARNKLNSSREELAKVEAKNASLKEASAASIAHKRILEEKNKFGGEIFGTVSELGQVESKYGVALEIAAGQKLKSIVVDSDKTAAECIKFLKREKLGTATFLPLNKIRSQKEEASAEQYAKTQGSHGMAINLLKFNPRFKNVFSYIFGSTIVVDNIEIARKVGVGNVRMATLDGDLTESSGAMIGGFRQMKKSMFGFQEKDIIEQIEQYQTDVTSFEGMINTLEKRRTENEEKIQQLRNFKGLLEAEITSKEKSLHLESDDLEASKTLKKQLQQVGEELSKELMSVELKISKTNSELAQMKIKKQQLRDKINELRNPRLIAEINAFEQKRSEFKQKSLEKEGSIKNILMQVKNILVPEQENIQKIIKQHEKEHENFSADIKRLQETIKEQSVLLKEKEKKQQEYYGAFKDLFKQREALNQEIQKREEKIIGVEETARKQEHQKNIYALEQAKLKAELSVIEEEFKKYEHIELYTSKNEDDLKREIFEFERMVERLGSVNLKALEVYENVEKEYNSLVEKREMLGREKEEVLLMMNEIETKKKELFIKTFDILNEHFRKMFVSLSTKGDAYLELENEKDPLAEGVNIKVKVTGKKFLDIRSLSGGEKTMTALAFIFAIQEHEPASFYVFDEVDAALDKRNSQKLAELVKQYADRAQYIIISHNDGVITEADTIYGVSMTQNNMSKVIGLKV